MRRRGQEGRKRELKRRIVVSHRLISRLVRIVEAGGQWSPPAGRMLERDGILDWTSFVQRNSDDPREPSVWYPRMVWYRSNASFDWWPHPIEADEQSVEDEVHAILLRWGMDRLTVGKERGAYWQVYFQFWDQPENELNAIIGSEEEPDSLTRRTTVSAAGRWSSSLRIP